MTESHQNVNDDVIYRIEGVVLEIRSFKNILPIAILAIAIA